MSVPGQFIDGETVEIPIRLHVNVEEMIHNQKVNHLRKFGQDADLIILGAQEYLDLSAAVSQRMYVKNGGPINWVSSFMGMDIILADRPGISLGFKDPQKWAVVFASETAKPRKGVLRRGLSNGR